MIVARIVSNILDGNGWSYNPGEIHNASTSVLNTILVLISSIVTEEILLSANVISALGIFTAITSIFLLFKDKYGVGASFLISSSLAYTLAHNTTWGVETNLFIGFLFLFILFEHRISSYFILGLLTLTRPDGLLVCGLKGLKDLISHRNLPFLGILIVTLLLLPWVVFSLIKFNQIFPDTLSVKVWQGKSGLWGHGLIYGKAILEHFSLQSKTNCLLLFFGFIGIYFLVKGKSPFLYAILFVGIQQAAYVLLNVPGYHWYFGAIDAVLVVTAFIGGIEIAQYFFSKIVPIQVALNSKLVVPALATLILIFITYRGGTERKDTRDQEYKNAILTVDSQIKSKGALGTIEVGSIGYYTNRKIIDLAGLASMNPEYLSSANIDEFYKNPPEILLLHEPLWHFERGIADDLRFEIVYKKQGVIPSDTFPMAYYLKTDAIVTPESLKAFLEKRYPPFVKQENSKVSDLENVPACIIDSINGNMRTPGVEHLKNRVLILNGWAVNENKRIVPSVIQIALVSPTREVFLITGKRHSRPDVGTHLKNSAFNMAGFSAEGSLLNLPEGSYDISIIQSDNDSASKCNPGFQIVIK